MVAMLARSLAVHSKFVAYGALFSILVYFKASLSLLRLLAIQLNSFSSD